MAAPIEPGRVLAGKYKVLRTLGEGGMGVVLAAEDLRLERSVAIKLLRPELASNKEASERFVREARSAAKVQSEHVARVIDVDVTSEETPLMVMEYLEGQDLEHAIAERGPLSIEDVALWVIQACDAVAEAHAQRIVHRDLKPANLFLARQTGGAESVKVLDFGISKQTAATSTNLSLTRTSALMGSPLYMSPEQMRSTRDVDTRTDIWALGAILHEALSGQPPFEGETITQLSANVLLEEPARLDLLRPDVPEALADVVWRALRKSPAERYAHVGELALALLPFAPRRATANIERIQRVLVGSGLVKEDFMLSEPPLGVTALAVRGPQSLPVIGREPTLPPSTLPPSTLPPPTLPPPVLASLAAKGRTLANFVQTGNSASARGRAPLWRAFAALGVLAAGAALLLGRAPPAEVMSRANAAPAAGAALEAPAALAATPSAAVATPSVAAKAPTSAAGESVAALAPSSAPSREAVAPPSSPPRESTGTRGGVRSSNSTGTRGGLRPGAPSSSTTTTSRSSSTTTTREAHTAESSTYSGTFKSKFGSRK